MVSSSQLIRGEMMTEDAESPVASNIICNKIDTTMISKSDGNTAADSIYFLFYDSE